MRTCSGLPNCGENVTVDGPHTEGGSGETITRDGPHMANEGGPSIPPDR